MRRIVADSVPEAIAIVRREMGRDAVIFATRRLPAAGWRGLFRRFDRIEVSAAVEDGGAAPAQPAVPAAAAPRRAPAAGEDAAGSGGTGPAPAGVAAPDPPPAPAPARSVPQGAAPASGDPGPALPAGAATFAEWLVAARSGGPGAPAPAPVGAAGVPAARPPQGGGPDGLRAAMFGPDGVPAALRAPEPVRARPGLRSVVVLVGPTGAGKTTTLAKLAAHLHLEQGWRVALLTADTFRVGGVEQIGAYARLLGLPCEVTPTPGSLHRALGRLTDCDVVLVDTSGRGHRDSRRMRDLASFLAAAREAASGPADAVEVHLVLAAPTRRTEAEAVLAAYGTAADRLIVTKLDECEAPPEALEAAVAAALPLSYCSAGQRVPEDLALAWPDRLVGGLPPPGARRGRVRPGPGPADPGPHPAGGRAGSPAAQGGGGEAAGWPA